MSNLSLLSIERHEFQFIFGHNLSNNSNTLVQNLLQLRESRKTDAITLIFKFYFFLLKNKIFLQKPILQWNET